MEQKVFVLRGLSFLQLRNEAKCGLSTEELLKSAKVEPMPLNDSEMEANISEVQCERTLLIVVESTRFCSQEEQRVW